MTLRQRLRDDELVLSTMVGEVRSPSVPQLIAAGGLDSFIIDMEHGAHDWGDMATLITVGKAIGLHPVVRIPEVRRETVLKPFDAGAAGILVPMIRTAEEVAEIVRWAKYPPAGARGVSLRRGYNDFRQAPMTEQLATTNEETTIIVQIETREAVEDIEKLVATPGLDAVFIGPNDLSIALGAPGRLEDPVMEEAYATVIKASLDAGVAVGYQAFNVEEARRLVDQGVRYLSYSTDTNALIDKASEVATGLRPAVGG